MNNRRTVLGLLAGAALTLCLSLPGFAPAADAAEASPAVSYTHLAPVPAP